MTCSTWGLYGQDCCRNTVIWATSSVLPFLSLLALLLEVELDIGEDVDCWLAESKEEVEAEVEGAVGGWRVGELVVGVEVVGLVACLVGVSIWSERVDVVLLLLSTLRDFLPSIGVYQMVCELGGSGTLLPGV